MRPQGFSIAKDDSSVSVNVPGLKGFNRAYNIQRSEGPSGTDVGNDSIGMNTPASKSAQGFGSEAEPCSDSDAAHKVVAKDIVQIRSLSDGSFWLADITQQIPNLEITSYKWIKEKAVCSHFDNVKFVIHFPR